MLILAALCLLLALGRAALVPWAFYILATAFALVVALRLAALVGLVLPWVAEPPPACQTRRLRT